jgi:hypothetical protein
MLALSIRQPWAALIVLGLKPVENREWATNVRGEILVHAGKTCTRREYESAVDFVRVVCGDYEAGWAALSMLENGPLRYHELLRGGLIGRVTLRDCVMSSRSSWFTGPYGFLLRNAHPLPFVPMKGQLGFWRVPMDPHEPV